MLCFPSQSHLGAERLGLCILPSPPRLPRASPSCCAFWGWGWRHAASSSCLLGWKKVKRRSRKDVQVMPSQRAPPASPILILTGVLHVFIHQCMCPQLPGSVAEVINIPVLKISPHLLCPTPTTKYNHSICSLPSKRDNIV